MAENNQLTVRSGPAADRPSASIATGTIYISTDTNVAEWYDGSAWKDIYIEGSTDVPIGDGGTGQSTQTAAFDALSPVTTAGDVIIRDGSNNIRLAIGTAFQHLRTNSGATAPEWSTETKSKSVTITNPVDGDRRALFMNEAGKEVLGVSFASAGGTSVLFNVEYAATIASGTVIHTDTCATSTPEWDVTPSGTTTVPTDQIVLAEITTVTGAVDQFHVTVHYRDNA